MTPTALVCLRVTFVDLGAEVILNHSILQDRVNSTDGVWLEVDVDSGSMLFDAVDASG